MEGAVWIEDGKWCNFQHVSFVPHNVCTLLNSACYYLPNSSFIYRARPSRRAALGTVTPGIPGVTMPSAIYRPIMNNALLNLSSEVPSTMT